jgi:glutamate synthase domain-containing protein 1/glutamate synthase domain-containing protein 3
MSPNGFVENLLASRKALSVEQGIPRLPEPKSEAEGGCGVIGIASSEKIPARHLLQALKQMRNRGNGKGGGIAAVGLLPEEWGVTQDILDRDYLLVIAYLDPSARLDVERRHIDPDFIVDHARPVPTVEDFRTIPGVEIQPPEVHQYFIRPKPEVVETFRELNGLRELPLESVEDEIVYQKSYLLNRAFYASAGEKRAFVCSHGKNLLVLKMVGYGDDVIRYYQLEDRRAHVWIGHHRYPTKGKVWHPGGAHPFVGLHEALVHNGDFANYSSLCEYLAQRNIYPLFLTDTEVSVLVFDLLHRTYGYPLEYVIEALAPTTERDFTLLPPEKQAIYEMIQTVHIHGSPDGPWFFLIAQSARQESGQPRCFRLIGITDTSMLRPQVFALQEGEAAIGFAASEKQAIDAALESLASEDARFWSKADRYWNARGGSHTDGGAFLFTVQPKGEGTAGSSATLTCTDKFGRRITGDTSRSPFVSGSSSSTELSLSFPDVATEELFTWAKARLPSWTYDDVLAFLSSLRRSAVQDNDRARAIAVLTRLIDQRCPTGKLRRSSLGSLFQKGLDDLLESIRSHPSPDYTFLLAEGLRPDRENQTLVIDARGFAPEGERSLASEIVRQYQRGFRKFLVARTQGHRFIANGLGPEAQGVRLDVYGSSGDYLASGIDGPEVYVHGSAQDQLAQIMKEGRLVIHGDVGQTFMYAAKGGQAYVLGNAAGRPLINAVGKPRVVINGTCLDYLAESFMAGDPTNGGGFVIVNGIVFDDEGRLVDLETPYPGGNLFSLASGGAVYLRDPFRKVSEEQLNGGEFAELEERDWRVIKPILEENERFFGIPLSRLLAGGDPLNPAYRVYRKVRPRAVRALQAEEAWVTNEGPKA